LFVNQEKKKEQSVLLVYPDLRTLTKNGQHAVTRLNGTKTQGLKVGVKFTTIEYSAFCLLLAASSSLAGGERRKDQV
jgi:hypothetical protein